MRKLNHTLILGLVATSLLAMTGRTTNAQELLVPPGNDGVGELPAFGSGTRGDLPVMELPSTDSVPSELQPTAEPIASGSVEPAFESLMEGRDYRAFDYQPAILESTGTWLRRGFWYSEIDAVVMDRVWARDNFTLALQINPEFGAANQLTVNSGRMGAEASPRLTLGRFLYRDHKNRDHNLEFVAFGGGQWSDSGRLDAANGGALTMGSYAAIENNFNFTTVRIPIDQGNLSFDGANSMQYEYESRFNNFELNYHLKARMEKDRMEMEPNGRWVRRAQPSISKSVMAGIRYFDLNEDFDIAAFDINNAAAGITAESGDYRIRTDNDLIGGQIGGSWTYETAHWSLGFKTKSGLYLNHTNLESQFEITNAVTSAENNVEVDNLSFLVEGGLLGKWHLRPNFSLRSGLEVMYISSVALASEQINFVPVHTSTLLGDGSVTYMGGTIGFEAYW